MEGENWVFEEDVVDYLDTVSDYHRSEEEGYEKLTLEAGSYREDDPAVVELFVEDEVAELHHMTNVDYRPLFDILDREYPPRSRDEVWVSDSEGFKRKKSGAGFDYDVRNFQFFRTGEPNFDLNWTDLSDHLGDGHSTPFRLKLRCWDPIGLSLDRPSSEPVEDVMPVMLRDDISRSSRGSLMKDTLQLLDYGLKSTPDTPMVYHLGSEELGSIATKTAQRFDPHR